MRNVPLHKNLVSMEHSVPLYAEQTYCKLHKNLKQILHLCHYTVCPAHLLSEIRIEKRQ